MSIPFRLATCQMVSSGSAVTARPSRVKRITSLMRAPPGSSAGSRAGGSGPPDPGRRWKRRSSRHSAPAGAARPSGRRFIMTAAFSQPTRQGVHCPQLSSSKKRIRLSAAPLRSSLSESTTTAAEPMKQPCASSVPKSSGRVGHGGWQDAARGAARQVGAEGVALGHAAAVLLQQLFHGDPGRRELDARLLHTAGNGKAVKAGASVAALTGEPGGAAFPVCLAPSAASRHC